MPQKQNSSPKMKRANGARKAEVAKAGRRAHPNKGRAKSNASKHGLRPGDKSLFEAVAEDRRQRRPQHRSPRFTPDRFIKELGYHVTVSAKRLDWSMTTRQLVCDYIKSLVNGDGSAPSDLRGKPLQNVQFKFAMCCVKLRVPDGALPGQSQDWFAEATAHAHSFWRSRRSAA